MNGFEAIKLMEQGKEVIEVFHDFRGRYIFKIMDNNVCYRSENASVYGVSESFDFSMEYEEYIGPKPLTGWERVDRDKEEKFTIITPRRYIELWEVNDEDCNDMYDRANYFSTKEKAEEIDFKQTLFRKLQRFSDENGGNEIDWSDGEQRKYFIYYCSDNEELDFYWHYTDKYFGSVYFNSEEIAKQAIELFHDDLIKYFTGDWSERNE